MGWAGSQVADAGHGSNLATEWYGLGSRAEKVIERAALIRLDVAESDVTQFLHRQDCFDGFTDG